MRSFVILVLVISGAFAGFAECAEPKSAPSMSPDVLVLVSHARPLGIAGEQPRDEVAINYTTQLPRQDAENDLKALHAASGWAVVNGRISTTADSTPGAKPTTSTDFYTQPIMNAQTGVLPLEPFIMALKRYKSILIIFMPPQDFQLRGPKSFENQFVKITPINLSGTYQYRVEVKDSSFDKLDLSSPQPQGGAGKAPMMWAIRFIMALGLALVAAVVVFIGVDRVLKKRKAISEGR